MASRSLPAQVEDDDEEDDLLLSLARDKEQETKDNANDEEEDLLLSLEKEAKQGQKEQEMKLKNNNTRKESNVKPDDDDLMEELKKEMSIKPTRPKPKPKPKSKSNKVQPTKKKMKKSNKIVQSTKVVPIQQTSSEVNFDDDEDDNFDDDNETDDSVCGDYAIMVQNGIVWIIQPGHPPEERGRAKENNTLTIKLTCPQPKEEPTKKQVVYSCQGQIIYVTNFIDKDKQWSRPKGAFAVIGGGQSSAVKNLKWLVSRRSYSTDGTVRVEEKKKKMSFPTRASVVVSTNGKQTVIIGRKEGADDDDTRSSVKSKKMPVSFDANKSSKKDEIIGITFQYCRSNDGDEQKCVAGLSSFENPGKKDANLHD